MTPPSRSRKRVLVSGIHFGKDDVGARHFRDAQHGVAHMPKFHVCENDKSVPSAAKRCSAEALAWEHKHEKV